MALYNLVVTPHALYTVENLVPILHPICSKWKKLGMVMSVDDDYLDQVFTNNEGDEACLRDLLERYMDNGDFQHNWEEIVAILKKMDENVLASNIYDLHVHPCKYVSVVYTLWLYNCACFNYIIRFTCTVFSLKYRTL